MALCLAVSLIEKRGFDAKDQMDRYCGWREQGYLTSNGRCFDIGNTVQNASSIMFARAIRSLVFRIRFRITDHRRKRFTDAAAWLARN
jgi:hypothetical protein